MAGLPNQTRDVGTLERHGQSIVTALILASIIYVGKTLTAQQETLAVVSSRLQSLESKFENTEAKYMPRDLFELNKLNLKLEHEQLSRRIETLERDALSTKAKRE